MPRMNEPRVLPLGEAAYSVELGETLSPEVTAAVLGLDHFLHEASAEKASPWSAMTEHAPALRSVTVRFDPLHPAANVLEHALYAAAKAAKPFKGEGTAHHLPVSFAPEEAPDLMDTASLLGMTPSEVKEIILTARLRCLTCGFLPGFPYLHGLPPAFADLPRMKAPRVRVPASSLAAAAGLCGIYPCASPGGWRLLGRVGTPVFDPQNEARPALIRPGDRVTFFETCLETGAPA